MNSVLDHQSQIVHFIEKAQSPATWLYVEPETCLYKWTSDPHKAKAFATHKEAEKYFCSIHWRAVPDILITEHLFV